MSTTNELILHVPDATLGAITEALNVQSDVLDDDTRDFEFVFAKEGKDFAGFPTLDLTFRRREEEA